MLILSRAGPKNLDGRDGELLTVTHGGEELRIQIQRVAGNQVYLAFDGPISFRIVRDDAKDKVGK